jgi:hypothetical protein
MFLYDFVINKSLLGLSFGALPAAAPAKVDQRNTQRDHDRHSVLAANDGDAQGAVLSPLLASLYPR